MKPRTSQLGCRKDEVYPVGDFFAALFVGFLAKAVLVLLIITRKPSILFCCDVMCCVPLDLDRIKGATTRFKILIYI